jgi:hypothetical protein
LEAYITVYLEGGLLLKKEIFCAECSGEIESRDDLVIAYSIFWVIPYHHSCYSKALKGCQTFFVGNEPINGASGTFKMVISLLFLMFLFFLPSDFMSSGGWLLIPLSLLIPSVRLYSWIRYERHLP